MLAGIIHFSTDYVFSGEKAVAYREDDDTGPLGVYGCSKLAGEKAVALANPAHVILRTARVYSPVGRKFVRTMLRLAAEQDVIEVVCDQRGTPTCAAFLARAVVGVVRHILACPDGADWRGIFHVVPGGATDWAGFAEEIFRQSAQRGGPAAVVKRIRADEYVTTARRPVNSCLDAARFSLNLVWSSRRGGTVLRLASLRCLAGPADLRCGCFCDRHAQKSDHASRSSCISGKKFELPRLSPNIMSYCSRR